tara:strand:- start:104 stop:880 length:777 start_codon:yes stop_codon:yes gene_type:complete
MDRSSKNLVKFCRKEHNILNGAPIRIGTLHEYRQIENPEIKDEDEGKYTFTIEFPEEITLDRRWSNLLFQGFFGAGCIEELPRLPGKTTVHNESFGIVRQFGENLTIRDTKLRIEREFPDCFIFCMSLMTKVENPFAGYDDKWMVPYCKIDEFTRALASRFIKKIQPFYFEESIAEFFAPKNKDSLNLMIRDREVIYVERNMVITESNRPSYESLFNTLANIPFTKPSIFKPEKEYRFLFELNNGEKVFQPAVKSFLM